MRSNGVVSQSPLWQFRDHLSAKTKLNLPMMRSISAADIRLSCVREVCTEEAVRIARGQKSITIFRLRYRPTAKKICSIASGVVLSVLTGTIEGLVRVKA